MDTLVQSVLEVVAGICATALAAVLVQWLRKLGLQIEAQQQGRIEHYAAQAILYVEEKAAKQLKGKIPMPSEEKLSEATERLMAKVPGISLKEAEDIVHAVLPQLKGTGATFAAELGKAIRQPGA